MVPYRGGMADSQNSYVFALTADLSRWRARIAELNNEIAVKAKERDDLSRKVDAAQTLLGQVDDDGEASSLRRMIQDLMTDGAIRKPRDMRKDLVARGVEASRVSSSTGNFYNSLARLVDDGTLMRDEDSRYWDPKKSRGPSPSMEDMLK